jgi:hypothetical protein
MIQPHFRHQSLKALAPLGTGARSAQILIDHHHPDLSMLDP